MDQPGSQYGGCINLSIEFSNVSYHFVYFVSRGKSIALLRWCWGLGQRSVSERRTGSNGWFDLRPRASGLLIERFSLPSFKPHCLLQAPPPAIGLGCGSMRQVNYRSPASVAALAMYIPYPAARPAAFRKMST